MFGFTSFAAVPFADSGYVSDSVNVVLGGISVTAQLGNETARAEANVVVVANQAIGQTGTVETDSKANVFLTSVTGSGVLNSVEIDSKGTVNVTGVQGIVFLGEEIARAAADVPVIGNQATGQTGVVNVVTSYYLTGVQATGQLGEEEIDAKATVFVTGVLGTVSVGTVLPRSAADVVVIGVTAIGKMGKRPLVWSEINDSQDPNWQLIAA